MIEQKSPQVSEDIICTGVKKFVTNEQPLCRSLGQRLIRVHVRAFSIFLFLLSLTLFSCKDDDTPENGGNTNSGSPFDLGNIEATYLENLSYDSKVKTTFDFWKPDSETPTGLVIYVHGGGFRGGDKDFVYQVQRDGDWDFPSDIRGLLSENIAFTSINYSLMNEQNPGVLKCFSDVAYAVQYFKHNAAEFNIDPERIVLAGNSAGAGLSLWVATYDDLSNPNSEDPIKGESTRVRGAVARRSQCSYDLKRWIEDVFIDYGITSQEMFSLQEMREAMILIYDLESIDSIFGQGAFQTRAILDILDHISPDDPELFLSTVNGKDEAPIEYSQYNHHVFHVRELIEACTNEGVPFVGYYGDDPVLNSDPSNENWVDFCIRKINDE